MCGGGGGGSAISCFHRDTLYEYIYIVSDVEVTQTLASCHKQIGNRQKWNFQKAEPVFRALQRWYPGRGGSAERNGDVGRVSVWRERGRETETQRDRQTDRQRHRETETQIEAYSQTNSQTERQTDLDTDRLTETDRQTYRVRDRQTETDSEREREKARQTDRWTARQTDGRMDGQTDRQTDFDALGRIAAYRNP